MKPNRAPNSDCIRILYLRTFRDSASDHTLIASLAEIVSGFDKLALIGPKNEEVALRSYWQKRFRRTRNFDEDVDYLQSDDNQWRRLVNLEISKADLIFLFLAPKGDTFPRFRKSTFWGIQNTLNRNPNSFGYKRFEKHFWPAPLEKSSGSGLLHEVAYLERLKKIKRTIVICDSKHYAYVTDWIELAISSRVGMFLRVTRWGAKDITPRLSALDAQIAHLRNAAGIVPFRRRDLKNPHNPQFPSILKSLVELVCSKPRTARGIGPEACQILLGRSTSPRRLPPDGAQKIIQFTNVENLIEIPPYKLIDISHEEVWEVLGGKEASRGCPICSAALRSIFFYTEGLRRRPDEEIRGRCQCCYINLMLNKGKLVKAYPRLGPSPVSS